MSSEIKFIYLSNDEHLHSETAWMCMVCVPCRYLSKMLRYRDTPNHRYRPPGNRQPILHWPGTNVWISGLRVPPYWSAVSFTVPGVQRQVLRNAMVELRANEICELIGHYCSLNLSRASFIAIKINCVLFYTSGSLGQNIGETYVNNTNKSFFWDYAWMQQHTRI